MAFLDSDYTPALSALFVLAQFIGTMTYVSVKGGRMAATEASRSTPTSPNPPSSQQ